MSAVTKAARRTSRKGHYLPAWCVSLTERQPTRAPSPRADLFPVCGLWGLGCLLVPFVSLIFLLLHPDKAFKPFILKLAGIGSCVVWAALTASLAPSPGVPPPVPTASVPHEPTTDVGGGKPAVKKPPRRNSWQGGTAE